MTLEEMFGNQEAIPAELGDKKVFDTVESQFLAPSISWNFDFSNQFSFALDIVVMCNFTPDF